MSKKLENIRTGIPPSIVEDKPIGIGLTENGLTIMWHHGVMEAWKNMALLKIFQNRKCGRNSNLFNKGKE